MISVIVPVYNMKEYLARCVDSILGQTYRDFELILVDDGSTDISPALCDEYAANDSRVRVIHKENGGLSAARNTGVNIASGHYVIFIDSDDWVREDTLELLLAAAERHDAEVSIGRFRMVETSNVPDGEPLRQVVNKCVSGEEALRDILYGRLYGTTACGFLVKTDLARKYPFPVGRYHEDDFTTFRYYLSSNTIAVTDTDLYYYFQRGGSIMHCEKSDVLSDQLDAADHILAVCEKAGTEVAKAASARRFSSYCQVLMDHPNLQKTEPILYARLLAGLKEEAQGVLKDSMAGKRMRLYAFCHLIGHEKLLLVADRILSR